MKKNKIYIDVMNLLPIRPARPGDSKPSPQKSQENATEQRDSALNQGMRDKTLNEQKLEGLIHKTENVLLKVKNMIPILPDEIVIDSTKVSIVYRTFFFSERIQSVSIKDITDIYIETIPFLATINIVDSGFTDGSARQNTPLKIRWILKKDAEKARRIITGLMEASKEEIDLKSVSDHDLANKMEEIGKIKKTTTSVTNA